MFHSIRRLEQAREGKTLTSPVAKAKITVLSLGGTIASTKADVVSSGVTPQLTANDLISAVPELLDVADVAAVEFRSVPSGDLTFTDIVALAKVIDRCFEEGTDGVVITQGTDTIEETSFALELLVRGSRPVIVTGAMRNPTMVSPDGPANLLASVLVAASPDAAGLGTLVVLNDEIHASRFVRKSNTSSLATFHSPSCGPLGWIIEGRVRVVLRVPPLAMLDRSPVDDVPAIALIKISLGDDARVIEQIASLGYAGAVVEGFGGGHVPAAMVPGLETLASRMPVVLASRTGSGELLQRTYGFAGSEQDLLARGVLSAGPLDGLKARVLLSLTMSIDGEYGSAREAFERVVASVTSSNH